MKNMKETTHQPTMHLAYHQGYDPIYNASYDFGFVFIDEEELEDDDADFNEDDDDAMMLIH